LVQEALDKLAHGRTTLVIAHRLATVRDAHKIVVMDKGRVVDEGTHDELLARQGVYAQLHAIQFRAEGPTADMLALAKLDPHQADSEAKTTSSAPLGVSSRVLDTVKRWFAR
jgi:ATP-binding cassette, subfamily B, bacterial MsbA